MNLKMGDVKYQTIVDYIQMCFKLRSNNLLDLFVVPFAVLVEAFGKRSCEYYLQIKLAKIAETLKTKLVDRMKITDLNIDCLEAVLDCLDFQDLLNAASSNKRINHAAKFVFIRKYDAKNRIFRFWIDSIWYRSNRGNRMFNFKGKTMGIFARAIALPLLRCFGGVIHKIQFHYSKSFYDKYITSYMNKFCTESLIEIEIWKMPKSELDYFRQPFTRIEKVYLYTEYRHEPAEDDWLNRIFPKMKELKLSSTVPFKNGDIVNHFPCLECLEIRHYSPSSYFLEFDQLTAKDVCSKNIISTLKLNPQLKKFDLTCISEYHGLFDVNILESTKDSLQNLESLVLSVYHDEFFRNFNNKIIYLKNVKYLKIAFPRLGFFNPQTLPFSFDKLETLIFQLYYFEYFCRFIEKFPTISTLGLDFEGVFTFQSWERLVEICPSVTTINCISNYSFGIDAILNIIAIFKSLKCITFSIRDARSRYLVLLSIKPIFNDDWMIFIHDTGLKYSRSCQILIEYYVDLKRRI